jgi:oligopeptide transport system permease protein
MNIYQAHYHTVNFYYDYYGDIFGERKDFVIGESIMNEYIAKGWCKFDNFDDASTFQVLNEKKCPITSVNQVMKAAAGFYQFKCNVIYYKYKGYSSSPRYLFGTDALGHDLLTVALSSLKTSLLVAIISSAVCLAIGLVWGSISGYFGGTVDLAMERFTDILSGVPWIVVMTLTIIHLGSTFFTFALALCLTGWIGTSHLTRTQFYRFRGREYVLASRTLGASHARLIAKHILPNAIGTIITSAVLMVPSIIFSEATISYLGLGFKNLASLGVILSDNQVELTNHPYLLIFPAIIIALLMISFNLFGNGLRDAVNPSLKGEGE